MRSFAPWITAALSYATVEMWFTEILRRYVYPSIFVASSRAFTVALVASYAVAGLVLAAVTFAVWRLLRREHDLRVEYATAALTLIVAVNVFVHLHRSLIPVAMTAAALFLLATLAAWSAPVRQRASLFVSPWTASVMIVGPDWFANDYLIHASHTWRLTSYALVLLLVMAVCYAVRN